jgi:hypothetical protein
MPTNRLMISGKGPDRGKARRNESRFALCFEEGSYRFGDRKGLELVNVLYLNGLRDTRKRVLLQTRIGMSIRYGVKT